MDKQEVRRLIGYGTMISHYMKHKNKTVKWLSEVTGIERQRLHKCLQDRRELTLAEYALICGALDVEVDKFISPRKK